ncbi:MAG TPA: hypothetical protein PLK58_15780 [Candidatus Rifleibacterium sp.]|nr:hypothetical protein [Candidatus Rifleibacterium sp.]
MFRVKFFGFLAAFLFVGLICSAADKSSEGRFLQIISGEYRFRLQVIGMSPIAEIQNATASISIYKNEASIEVSAPGYNSNCISIKLKEGVYYYESPVYMPDPTMFLFLRDHTLKQIKDGIVFLELEPSYTCWYDEICIAGGFFKAGFENLSANDFHVHINQAHDYAWPPRVFIFDCEDHWRFEVIFDRTTMKSNKTNKIDIIITRNGEHNQPQTKYLQYMAAAYGAGLEKLNTAEDEADFLRWQERLAATASELTRNFASLNPETQSEILAQLSDDWPLTRDLKSIATFAHLHN